MESLKKVSLVDMAYERLREGIIHLEFPLGGKVNVNELQSRLGISCTPIREAVNRLQQEGLVVYENNVGAHVLTLTPHDVVEIQQLAMALHRSAVCLAMENGDRSALLQGLEVSLRACRAAASPEEAAAAIGELIGVYYHCCGNRRLDSSMLSLQGQQRLLRYLYALWNGTGSQDLEMLSEMVEKTRLGDAEAVCRALQRYTDHMTAALTRRLAQGENP